LRFTPRGQRAFQDLFETGETGVAGASSGR
jgi:hypothetical protein